MRIAIPVAAAAIALSACAAPEQAPSAPTTTPAPQSTPAQQGSSHHESGHHDSATAETKRVPIVDFTFQPADLTVPVGTTVVWTQRDQSTHTVDFDDGTQSGDMAKGDTYRRTFTEPGTYPYICFYHPDMTGKVTVTG